MEPSPSHIRCRKSPVLPFLGCSVLPRKTSKFTKDFFACRKHKNPGEAREKMPILAKEFLARNQPRKSLRAKGTLISEPRFSTPCEMRFFPTRERENGLFKEKTSTKAVSPFSRGKNRISQGVENWGSLISVPLALRDPNDRGKEGQGSDFRGASAK